MKQRTVWMLILILPMILLVTYAAVSGEPADEKTPVTAVVSERMQLDKNPSPAGLSEPRANPRPDLDLACAYPLTKPPKRDEKQKFIFASKIPESGYRYNDDGITTLEDSHAEPKKALGAPTHDDPIHAFALGNVYDEFDAAKTNPRECKAYLIVEFEELFIEDRSGADICIYELGTNVSQGATEAVHVYVSPDDSLWYYWGQTDKINTTAIDLSVAEETMPKDTLFRYVAVCDVVDTLTSGKPGPGPDIDAIGGLNFAAPKKPKEDLAVIPKTEGVKIGEKEAAADQVASLPDLKDEEMTVEPEAEVEVLSICEETITELIRMVGIARKVGDDEKAKLYIRTLRAVLKACSEDEEGPASAAEGRTLEFELASGGMQFESLTPDMFLNIETAVAYVSSTGRARFDVVLNAQGNRATVTVQRGPVTIWPFDPDLPKTVLPSGATVVVTEDSISDPMIKASAFMPMVRK